MRSVSSTTILLMLAITCFTYAIQTSANDHAPLIFINVYLYPWEDQLLNKETASSIRYDAPIHIEIREKIYAQELLHILHINKLLKSSEHASSLFKTQLVLDVYDGRNTYSYFSDGKQLCSEDLMHCISVNESFKRRFDPSY